MTLEQQWNVSLRLAPYPLGYLRCQKEGLSTWWTSLYKSYSQAELPAAVIADSGHLTWRIARELRDFSPKAAGSGYAYPKDFASPAEWQAPVLSTTFLSLDTGPKRPLSPELCDKQVHAP